MEGQYTGGDTIVQILKSAGVECVFSIINIHNIPIYDAIARQGVFEQLLTVANQAQSIWLMDMQRLLVHLE